MTLASFCVKFYRRGSEWGNSISVQKISSGELPSFFCELRESDGSTILYGLCMGDQSGEVQFRCTKSMKESVLPSYWRVEDV